MKFKAILLLSFLTIGSIFSQTIQSPSEFLGYEIGSRFTRHHKVVDYFEYVSNTLSNMEKRMNIDLCMSLTYHQKKTSKI